MITHVNSKTNTNHQNIRMYVFPDTKSTNLHSHLCYRFAQRNLVQHIPAVSSRLFFNKDYCYFIFVYTRTSDASSSYLQIRKYACHSHGHAYLCIYRETKFMALHTHARVDIVHSLPTQIKTHVRSYNQIEIIIIMCILIKLDLC